MEEVKTLSTTSTSDGTVRKLLAGTVILGVAALGVVQYGSAIQRPVAEEFAVNVVLEGHPSDNLGAQCDPGYEVQVVEGDNPAPGLVLASGQKEICVDINPCNGDHACLPNTGTCVDIPASQGGLEDGYTCECANGYANPPDSKHQCQPVPCPSLTIDNSNAQAWVGDLGNSKAVICDAGFGIDGTSAETFTVDCQAVAVGQSDWSGVQKCEAVTCAALTVANSGATNVLMTTGMQYTIECNAGYSSGGNTPLVELSGDNDGAATNLQACIGECDSDDQCAAGLTCFQRDGDIAIPGCSGTGVSGWDYCHKAPDNSIPLSGGNVGSATNLAACTGECDSDDQCAAGLKCFQSESEQTIPGCTGTKEAVDWDYCYDPNYVSADTTSCTADLTCQAESAGHSSWTLTQPLPTCDAMQCTAPVVAHAYVYSVGDVTTGGEFAMACENGYHDPNTGAYTFTVPCVGSGCSAVATPTFTCEPMPCNTLTVAHSDTTNLNTGLAMGAPAYLSTCNAGFKPTVEAGDCQTASTCAALGLGTTQWSPTGVCEPVQCAPFTGDNFGATANTFDESTGEQVQTQTCASGYAANGAASFVSTCDPTAKCAREWSNVQTCDAITCSMLEVGNSDTESGVQKQTSESHTVTCNDGYCSSVNQESSFDLTCAGVEAGSVDWTGKETCEPVSCAPLQIANSNLKDHTFSGITGQAYEVICDEGYASTDCSQWFTTCVASGPCSSSWSQSQLSCVKIEDLNVGSVQQLCDSNPCQNGGQCTNGDNTYTCDCTGTGYTGSTCQEQIDECAASPCQNGGTCTDGINSYTCACVNGYTGTNCETSPVKNNCLQLYESDNSLPSGTYTLTAPSGQSIDVYCDFEANDDAGPGWTRFLSLSSASKSCTTFATTPLDQEIVDSCNPDEFKFSRSMMLNSNHELLYKDVTGRMMWYRFSGCNAGQCTCDTVEGDKRNDCFFLAVTADYSGGQPVGAYLGTNDEYTIYSEAWNWNVNAFENQGDGQCGGTNANGHSQFNCEPHAESGLGKCGQRWHYGTRDDGSGKGGALPSTGGAGAAWNWYTGLATAWQTCSASDAAWMMFGAQADGGKHEATVYFR
jgi:Notch-like protein